MGQGYVPELHDPNRCKAKEQLSASLADDDAHHLFEAVVAALDAERRFDLPAACMLGKSGAAPKPPVERPATLQRGFLRPDSRACRNDFPGARRDQDHRGKVAMPREYRAPAWIARLQASGSGSLHPRVSSADSSTTWASNAVRVGNTTSIAPTIKMGRHRGPMDKAAGRRSGFRRPATTPRRRVRVRRIPALHIPARRALGRQRREPRARPASPPGRMPVCRPWAIAR